MRRNILLAVVFCLVVTMFVFPINRSFANDDVDEELLLLDSDMVDIFDDGVAMMMLAKSPKFKLLGVTISTGNLWLEDCTASAIRQLEGLGITNIPVAMGKTPRRIENRFSHMEKEVRKFGSGFDIYAGAASYERPTDWRTAYKNRYGAEPSFEPTKEKAVDFIIRTIKEHPNEVTIVVIGPHTNLAAAIKKSPDIVPLVKRVVYMGGAFFQSGNVTPAAEFNIWVDPKSAKQVVRSPFKEQIFGPLDACDTVYITRDEFYALNDKIKSPILAEMMNKTLDTRDIFAGSEKTLIWDILAAAVLINSNIITEETTMPVDVNDVYSPSYGQTLAYRRAPQGAQQARIVLSVDKDEVRKMIFNLFDEL
ncbi:MAG: nucleoside hydrolase [Selenomonadaceae bacterium]|nr:nucleoside hydrolase [Selenomonadaceae bacterium]